ADPRFPLVEHWDDAPPPLQEDIGTAFALLERSASHPRDRMRGLTSPASRTTILQMMGRQMLVQIDTNSSKVQVLPDPEGSPVASPMGKSMAMLPAATDAPR